MTLAELYAEQCATPSDIYLHLPRFVEMVELLDASHVIELGTRTGVSTIAWLHALERTGGRYGLQTMCEGGGQANVTIIERL